MSRAASLTKAPAAVEGLQLFFRPRALIDPGKSYKEKTQAESTAIDRNRAYKANMSDRYPNDQTAPDPNDFRVRDDIVKIRRFILKKQSTASQKEVHKRRKKEISGYHNRLVQEDRDGSIEAKRAYRDIRIEDEEIGYCDDLLGLIGMGERVAAQDEEYLGYIEAEDKLLAELEQVRRKKDQVRDLRDRLFDEFGGMAGRLSGERIRIDAVRRAPLDEPLPQAAAPRPKAAPPVQASPEPTASPAPRPVPARPAAPAAPASPVSPPAAAIVPEPEAPLAQDDLSAPEEDILDLDASMIEETQPAPPQAEAKPPTPKAPMSDADIAALFDEKPAAGPAAPKKAAMSEDEIAALFDEKPAAKPGSQDDIDSLLSQAMDTDMAKPAAPKTPADPGELLDHLDDFNVDEELKFLDKK